LTPRPVPSVHRHRHRTAGIRGQPAGSSRVHTGAGGWELLTVDEVIAELRISRATFYRWRQLGRGPRAVRLPNGGLRITRAALSAWIDQLSDEQNRGPG
jgi:predicted DNA-binding transcriptional regulator AlpA